MSSCLVGKAVFFLSIFFSSLVGVGSTEVRDGNSATGFKKTSAPADFPLLSIVLS